MSIQNRLPWLFALVLLAGTVESGDIETFLTLERGAVREAERDLSRLFDRSTGRVLQAPSNAAERYVVEREQRWYRDRQRWPVLRAREDGGDVLELGPASMSTTWLVIGPSGELTFVCDSGGRHFSDGHPRPANRRETEVLR